MKHDEHNPDDIGVQPPDSDVSFDPVRDVYKFSPLIGERIEIPGAAVRARASVDGGGPFVAAQKMGVETARHIITVHFLGVERRYALPNLKLDDKTVRFVAQKMAVDIAEYLRKWV